MFTNTHVLVFTAPGSLRAPHVKLSASPLTAKRTKGGMFTPWDATQGEDAPTAAAWNKADECHKGRMSDTRLPTACQRTWWTSYTPPHSAFNTRPKYPVLLTRRLRLRELGSPVYIRLSQTMCYCLYSSGTGLQTEVCCANLNFLPTEHRRLFIKVNGPWSWISGAWKLGEKCFR